MTGYGEKLPEQKVRHPSSKIVLKPIKCSQCDRLRDAIVDANKIIIKEKEKEKQKAMEEDHSSKFLVETLGMFFSGTIIVLVFLAIIAAVYTIVDVIGSGKIFNIHAAVACWGLFALVIAFCFLAKHLATRRKLYTVLLIIFAFILVGILVCSILVSLTLLVAICFALFCTVFASFCYLAMQSLRQEKDRNYLVSYFSAITGIAALVVSIVMLLASFKM